MGSYFREIEISSFLIIEERSYSSASFLERLSFQNTCRIHFHVFFSGIIFHFPPKE